MFKSLDHSIFRLRIIQQTFLVYLIALFVTGCATQPIPKPVPTKFCGQGETQNCRPLTPGMQEGSTRGRSDDSKQQMMFYKAPEEIWPEDFKPTPQVCGSPFSGKLITR